MLLHHEDNCLIFLISIVHLCLRAPLTFYKIGRVVNPRNTKGEIITVLLASSLTSLDESVMQLKQKLSVVIRLIPN
jgi:hypothetical protein